MIGLTGLRAAVLFLALLYAAFLLGVAVVTGFSSGRAYERQGGWGIECKDGTRRFVCD